MSYIEAVDLKHSFKRRDEEGNVVAVVSALDGVTLQIEQGEFAAVIGHNGSGKSTFARHLNVLLKPQEGTLTIGGRNAADPEERWPIRQSTGMVFQNPDNQLVAGVVEEDVAFGPENLGCPSEEIIRRTEWSLESVGMLEYRKSSPNVLSGGQKQRVAIAGVMAMESDCIVFDESTAMLDPQGRAEVLKTAQRLNREKGVTVVWITHYMEEITQADRVFVMDRGKVCMSGTPREIFARVEELEDLGLDVPKVTKLAYELRKDGLDLPEAVLSREEFVKALQKLCKCKRDS